MNSLQLQPWKVVLPVLMLCAAVLFTVHTDDAQQPQVTVASRYSQLVNELFVPQRWLRLEESAASDGPELVWVPPQEPQQRWLAETYLRRSYLGEDVERFNTPRTAADRQLFSVTDGKLRVNPEAHVFVSPFQQRGRWTGQLYYAGATRPANLILQSLDLTPQLIEMTTLGQPFAAARERAADITLFGSRSAAIGSASMLRFLDARGREVALAWRIGNGMVVQLKAEAAQTPVRVRINGRLVSQVRNSIHHLPRRGVLLFENEKRDVRGGAQRRAWAVREAQDPNLIYDATSDVWHAGAQNPLMARVTEVLAAAARATGEEVEQSVTLTLSRRADQAAAEVLRASVAAVRAGRSAVSDARAAITLMDGTTGALLALPSWPETAAAASDVTESLQENHNFTRLAPGSVAKLLYSAAVLETHPELLTLAVNVTAEEFTNVAGIPLEDPIKEEGAGGTLNFVNAIAYSANRYAATLLTLASDEPGTVAADRSIADPADRFAINGIEQSRRPANLLFEPGRVGILVADVPWAQRMRELYEINTSNVLAPEARYRRYVWDGLPRSLRLSGNSAALLDSIAPATENLQLDRIDERDYRTRFLPLILGGGESRWSNIALAEAFASIVANRRVRARLVANSDLAAAGRAAGTTQFLDPEVRRSLLTGMNGVIRFGTGRTLGNVRRELARAACVQRGRSFELYGKTGTPELEDYVLSPAATVFNQMAREGLFIRDPASGAIAYIGLSESPLERKDLAGLRAAVKRTGSAAARHFQTYFKSSLAHTQCGRRSAQRLWEEVFAGIVIDNNDKLDRGYQTVRGEGGTLFSDRACVNKAPGKNLFGKHFVFVAAMYDQLPQGIEASPRCDGKLPEVEMTGVPAQSVVGVVAIEHVSAGQERLALEAAGRLLLGPVAEQLGLRIEAPARVPAKTAGVADAR
jgi:hypothetical protein